MLENAAAAKIQDINRGKVARKEAEQRQNAAVKLQAIQRGHAVRNSLDAAKIDEPVTQDLGRIALTPPKMVAAISGSEIAQTQGGEEPIMQESMPTGD